MLKSLGKTTLSKTKLSDRKENDIPDPDLELDNLLPLSINDLLVSNLALNFSVEHNIILK